MAVVVAVDVKVRRKEGKTRAEMRIDRAAANIAEPCLAAFYTWSRWTAGARLPHPGVFDRRLPVRCPTLASITAATPSGLPRSVRRPSSDSRE
jgi:hypothetical protein